VRALARALAARAWGPRGPRAAARQRGRAAGAPHGVRPGPSRWVRSGTCVQRHARPCVVAAGRDGHPGRACGAQGMLLASINSKVHLVRHRGGRRRSQPARLSGAPASASPSGHVCLPCVLLRLSLVLCGGAIGGRPCAARRPSSHPLIVIGDDASLYNHIGSRRTLRGMMMPTCLHGTMIRTSSCACARARRPRSCRAG